MSKEVAVIEEDADIELAISEEEAALIEANRKEVDESEFTIPILKLAQPLTDEVSSGIARPGDFVLGLTGKAFEPPIDFVVASKGKGRFRPGAKGVRTLVAYDTPIVPDTWTDDPFVGQPFSEHPDAEEQYKAAVDRKDHAWGSGPKIQTTFNYVGFIVGSEVPVRLSLRRTSSPTARKWNTLLDAVLRGRFWDKTFSVGSELQKNAEGQPYYVATVTLGRPTSKEEKQAAISLATILRTRQVRTVGEEGDGPLVEPDSKGGLEV